MARIVTHQDGRIQERLWQKLGNEARHMVERLLNRTMDAERMAFLGCVPYERTALRRGHRNGYETRRIDSQWGCLSLRAPRVRGAGGPFRPVALDAWQRRDRKLERCVMEWVASGMPTRAVSREMNRAFGAILSATTVSNIIAQVDAEMAAFRARPIQRGYRYVYLDGKYGKVSQRPRHGRGRGYAKKSVLLLAWGIRHDGREELIDFRVAPDESEASWDAFLQGLRQRGLTEQNPWAERLARIISDGAGGIEAALALNYPETPHQVCVFHKVKNILGDLNDKSCKGRIQSEAGRVFKARTRAEALARLERWKRRWHKTEPLAVGHFVRDIDRMLLFYESPRHLRRRLKTSNPEERERRWRRRTAAIIICFVLSSLTVRSRRKREM